MWGTLNNLNNIYKNLIVKTINALGYKGLDAFVYLNPKLNIENREERIGSIIDQVNFDLLCLN